jgi:hypothetical protein
VRILAQAFQKSVWIKNLDRLIIYNILPFIISVTVFILSFTAILNFNNFNTETGSEAYGSIASYGYLIFVAFFITMLFIITCAYWWELKNSTGVDFFGIIGSGDLRKDTLKDKVIFWPYRIEHFMHYSYPLFFIIRRILVALILSCYYYDGFWQLCYLSLLSGISLVYLTSYAPYTSRIRNIVAAMFTHTLTKMNSLLKLML